MCAAIAIWVWRRQKEPGLLRPSWMLALSCISLLNAATVWAVGAAGALALGGLALRLRGARRSKS
ncbi:hypothetical protein [Streptomyces thermocarboxydovorans]|uniref:hypothetical protein n=1 Tax=Streptomyces thermocarboxydovorans TaxID=59298 RepID=UPI0031DBAA5F